MTYYTAPSHIYFLRPIGMAGPIKIGASSMPENRLKLFCYWSPFPLEIILTIPGDVRLEMRLHNAFDAEHSHYEWFFASPRLLQAIEDLKTGRKIEHVIDMTAPANRRLRVAAQKRSQTWKYGELRPDIYPPADAPAQPASAA